MNLGDLRTSVKATLSVTLTNDPFFTNDILNLYINRGIHWVEDQHFWAQTEKSMKRDAEENLEDYSIPTSFKERSIHGLEVDGEDYTKLSWNDYRKVKREYVNGYTKPVFGVYQDKFFLYPAPTADGVKNIFVWGQGIAPDMTADSDTHPFIRTPKLEEAVQEYALSLCYRKMRGSFKAESREAFDKAKAFVAEEWQEQVRQRANEQTVDTERFEHVDYLSVDGSTRRGNFNTY